LRVDLVLWLLELPRLLDGSLPLPLDLELLVLATQRCVSMLLARAEEETTDTTKWSSCAGTSYVVGGVDRAGLIIGLR
jgi:hypothetical protein